MEIPTAKHRQNCRIIKQQSFPSAEQPLHFHEERVGKVGLGKEAVPIRPDPPDRPGRGAPGAEEENRHAMVRDDIRRGALGHVVRDVEDEEAGGHIRRELACVTGTEHVVPGGTEEPLRGAQQGAALRYEKDRSRHGLPLHGPIMVPGRKKWQGKVPQSP